MVMKEGTKTITFRVDSKTKFSIEMASHAENMLVNNWITNIIKNLSDMYISKEALKLNKNIIIKKNNLIKIIEKSKSRKK